MAHLQSNTNPVQQADSRFVPYRRQHAFPFAYGHIECKACGCLFPQYYCSGRGICWECQLAELFGVGIDTGRRGKRTKGKESDGTFVVRSPAKWRERHKAVFAVKCGDVWPPMLVTKQRQARWSVEPFGD